MNRENILYTVIFTFGISFLLVFLLALADSSTADLVEENEILARRTAILNAFSLGSETPEEVASNFALVSTEDVYGTTVYRTTIGGEEAIAKEFSGSGLWGTISGIVGVTADLERTTGIEIISQNETPGLGARIDEAWFKDQFRGERIVNGTITVASAGEGDSDHENGTVDAITGASRTSDAIQTILDAELEHLAELSGGNR